MRERRYEEYKSGKKVDLSFRCYKKYLQLGKMIIAVLLLSQKTTVANQRQVTVASASTLASVSKMELSPL